MAVDGAELTDASVLLNSVPKLAPGETASNRLLPNPRRVTVEVNVDKPLTLRAPC